ncbi:MAG: hypothetical protein H0X66_15660 [Verrucomicrobia bacterium]|nr:hypothetical protein [Verrucomicrobiota bacterium]
MQGKNVLFIFLILLAAGFGIGLIVLNNKAKDEKQGSVANITRLSNDVVQTQEKLQDQQQVNLSLEGNLAQLKQEIATVTGKLGSTESTLATTKATLAQTQAEAKAAAEAAAAEVAKRDSRIQELEGQNDDLTQRMVELNISLGSLEKQIADTELKLAASEGDRDFLLKELKRLQAEKAELEKQFNDLAVLREQVSKLKEELSIARRLEWIRRGIYGTSTRGGAEGLIRPNPVVSVVRTNVLNVELRQDGTTTIVAPTNAPAK